MLFKSPLYCQENNSSRDISLFKHCLSISFTKNILDIKILSIKDFRVRVYQVINTLKTLQTKYPTLTPDYYHVLFSLFYKPAASVFALTGTCRLFALKGELLETTKLND